MKKVVVIVVSLLLCQSLHATDKGQQIELGLQAIRTVVQLQELDPSFLSDEKLALSASFIRALLANTSEQHIHQMNGATGNKVFQHADGREAVYDENGTLVTEGGNQGSYNYFHPQNFPLCHFSVDILPWLIWGNGKTDTTSTEQRTIAYVSDLRDGLERLMLVNKDNTLSQGLDFSQSGQTETISFFLSVFKKANFDLHLFVAENIRNPTEQRKFLEAVRLGFGKILNKT